MAHSQIISLVLLGQFYKRLEISISLYHLWIAMIQYSNLRRFESGHARQNAFY